MKTIIRVVNADYINSAIATFAWVRKVAGAMEHEILVPDLNRAEMVRARLAVFGLTETEISERREE